MPLNIALTSYSGYGHWFSRRLLKEGHRISIFNRNKDFNTALSGLVPKPIESKPDDYSGFDLSIFDLTGRERTADSSSEVCPTIGDGSLNCKLEEDRGWGIELMEQAGIEVPPYERFADIKEAVAYVRKTQKRYVFKPDGGQEQDADTTYVSSDAGDMLSYLSRVESSGATGFILQEFITGTEVSIEGWFDGANFWLLNFTLEDKKFMNENKGPNTGCSGNLVGLIKSTDKIYTRGLEKAKDLLSGLGYKGMIDLNTIVTDDKAYGLEWTPRFGYDASATLSRMYSGNYGEMLTAVASGFQPDHLFSAEYGASVRLSIPPYPSEIKGKHKAGVICSGLVPDRDYLYDVGTKSPKNSVEPTLETVGISGFIGAPIAINSDPTKAWEHLNHIVKGIKIPNMQHRTDCDKSSLKKLATLKSQGWL